MTAPSLRDRIARALYNEGASCGECRSYSGWDSCDECRRHVLDLADVVLAVLADADPTDLGMEASGVWYCRRHAGTANEDEHRGLCPWWDHADHCDAEHDEGLDDGACSPCEWVELLIPPAHPRTKETPDA